MSRQDYVASGMDGMPRLKRDRAFRVIERLWINGWVQREPSMPPQGAALEAATARLIGLMPELAYRRHGDIDDARLFERSLGLVSALLGDGGTTGPVSLALVWAGTDGAPPQELERMLVHVCLACAIPVLDFAGGGLADLAPRNLVEILSDPASLEELLEENRRQYGSARAEVELARGSIGLLAAQNDLNLSEAADRAVEAGAIPASDPRVAAAHRAARRAESLSAERPEALVGQIGDTMRRDDVYRAQQGRDRPGYDHACQLTADVATRGEATPSEMAQIVLPTEVAGMRMLAIPGGHSVGIELVALSGGLSRSMAARRIRPIQVPSRARTPANAANASGAPSEALAETLAGSADILPIGASRRSERPVPVEAVARHAAEKGVCYSELVSGLIANGALEEIDPRARVEAKAVEREALKPPEDLIAEVAVIFSDDEVIAQWRDLPDPDRRGALIEAHGFIAQTNRRVQAGEFLNVEEMVSVTELAEAAGLQVALSQQTADRGRRLVTLAASLADSLTRRGLVTQDEAMSRA